MCGLTALLLRQASTDLEDDLVVSLTAIQHRGYDGAGLAVDNPSNISLTKGKGLINEVLTDLPHTNAKMGIAHTRYKTIGECTTGASQPLLNKTETICLVHNGQIEATDFLPDSVKILKEFKAHLPDDLTKEGVINNEMICRAVHHIYRTIVGAYSCVIMIHNYGLVAFRDPHGVRPLVYSKNAHGDYIVASEDVCVRKLKRFKLSMVEDIPPGTCMIFELNNDVCSYPLMVKKFKPCIFEYIYLAHHNSTLNGIDVRQARRELGYLLASKITSNKYRNLDVIKSIDWVIPIPETSCIATQVVARVLGRPYIAALKLNPNRRKARTFILPTQEQRVKAVKNKFWLDEDPVVRENLEGSTVLLVDDSVVRGTTLKCVVEMLRTNAKVKSVVVASLAPAVRYKNLYGIDIPDDSLLIAKDRTDKEIAEKLNADVVIYQDCSQMVESFLEMQVSYDIDDFECSLFTGTYLD